MPAYLGNRIGIDFSSDEKVNANWEQLLRLLYGQPQFVKPPLGKPPSYLAEVSAVPDPARRPYQELLRAIESNSARIDAARDGFLNACIEFADGLRTRERPPEGGDPGERIVADCARLMPVRDHIVDWVLLEAGGAAFEEKLIETLERLAALKSVPQGMTVFDSAWFEAHAFLIYETFLYIIAALVRRRMFGAIHRILSGSYLNTEAERFGGQNFRTYRDFYYHSDTIQAALNPAKGRKWLSAAAELVSRQANRSDIRFLDVAEADFLIFFRALVVTDQRWYPQLLYKKDRYERFAIFIRAERHRDFVGLMTILGSPTMSAPDVKKKATQAIEGRMFGEFWPDDILRPMNLDRLDTLPD